MACEAVRVPCKTVNPLLGSCKHIPTYIHTFYRAYAYDREKQYIRLAVFDPRVLQSSRNVVSLIYPLP